MEKKRMENKMQDSKRWRKDWKYLQEKLPLTTGWVTDGVDDWRTDKEVTEELMDFIDSEISKAKEEMLKKSKKIYMERDKMSRFIESELDKLSKKNKCSGK